MEQSQSEAEGAAAVPDVQPTALAFKVGTQYRLRNGTVAKLTSIDQIRCSDPTCETCPVPLYIGTRENGSVLTWGPHGQRNVMAGDSADDGEDIVGTVDG